MIDVDAYIESVVHDEHDASIVYGMLNAPVIKLLKGAGVLVETLKTMLSDAYSAIKSDYIDNSSYIMNSLRKSITIVYPLVDHCNMSCAHCWHFSPVSKPNIVDYDMVLSDIKMLNDLFRHSSFNYTISLTGGDPLMYPHLAKLLWDIPAYQPTEWRNLVSNAMLWSKLSTELIEAFKHQGNRFSVEISRYPSMNDEQVERMAYDCDKAGIRVAVNDRPEFEVAKMFGDAYDISDRVFCHPETNCLCSAIRNGMFYPCAAELHSMKLGVELPINGIPVTDFDNSDEAILMMLLPRALCRHCHVNTRTMVNWHTSKRTLDEFYE